MKRVLMTMVGSSRKSESDLVGDIKAHVLETFEQIAEEFDGTRYKPWPETVDYLKTVPEGTTVLDLGVGNGRNSVHAISSGKSIIGVDISDKMVRLARMKFHEIERGSDRGNAEFIKADLGSLPIRTSSVSAAVCVATLHHVPSVKSREGVVDELQRVLTRGGTALVSVWDLDQPRFKQELARQLYCVCGQAPGIKKEKNGKSVQSHPPPYEFGDVWVPWNSKDGEVHYRFYHLFYHNELVELMEKAGFEIVKYFRRADNHNVVVRKL